MTDTKMSFKDALIAHLNGEKVEARLPGSTDSGEWGCLVDKFGEWNFSDDWKLCLLNGDFGGYSWEFRIKPRTVMCNGVEVPAPESVAPAQGTVYYTPHVTREPGYNEETWDRAAGFDLRVLEHGLVYINKEDAIARAKAMLITK